MNKAEYLKYQAAVQHGLKGLTHVSTGACPGCVDCGLPDEPTDQERELAEEPNFSRLACDCCGSRLGGDRHPAHGFLTQDGAEHLCHMQVCSDCEYYLNYGQLDDSAMMEIEAS